MSQNLVNKDNKREEPNEVHSSAPTGNKSDLQSAM